VTSPSRQRAPVHLDDKLQQPLSCCFLDGSLVERPGASDDFTVRPHGHVEGHPLLDCVALADHAIDHLAEILALRLGEEPSMAEIHAQQWRSGRPGELCATQKGAVAAQDHDELTPVSRGRGYLDDVDVGQLELWLLYG